MSVLESENSRGHGSICLVGASLSRWWRSWDWLSDLPIVPSVFLFLHRLMDGWMEDDPMADYATPMVKAEMGGMNE